MKIKGAIKNLNFKKIESENSKNTSRNFSGAVVGSVGSVLFQIVTCSSLYLFSRSVAPPMLSQCLLWGFNLLPLSLPERFPLLCLF